MQRCKIISQLDAILRSFDDMNCKVCVNVRFVVQRPIMAIHMINNDQRTNRRTNFSLNCHAYFVDRFYFLIWYICKVFALSFGFLLDVQMFLLSQGCKRQNILEKKTTVKAMRVALFSIRFVWIWCERIVYAIKLLYHLNVLGILTIYKQNIQFLNHYSAA